MPIGVTGAVALGGAALSAGASLIGGSQAAGAANKAAGLSEEQYNRTRKDLLPFADAGRFVLNDLVASAQSGQTGGGPNYLDLAYQNLPGKMTQAELEQTPGYQFNLAQGLKATQSAAAARGLGVSGAALKGAATYATGLADSTYQNQFNNAQTRYSDIYNLNTGQQSNITNQYNRLAGVATLGENAAAQTGTQGTALAGQAGNALMAGGNAQAAGTAGVGNAFTGAANNYLLSDALQKATGRTRGYNGDNVDP
jgi:hypothetical protein